MNEQEQTYALIEISIGPLPADVTWDDPLLEQFSGQVAELIHGLPVPQSPTGTDADLSGMITKVVRDRHLGLTDDSPLNAEEVYAHLGHYVSSYCIHEDHENCRLTCKTCKDPCRCHCHGGTHDPQEQAATGLCNVQVPQVPGEQQRASTGI